jgi:hypothetical protein
MSEVIDLKLRKDGLLGNQTCSEAKYKALLMVKARATEFRNYALMCLNNGADPQHLNDFLTRLDAALALEESVK